MSISYHWDALTAFEGNDLLILGLQSKINSYQKKQQQEHKAKTDINDNDWVRVQRSLVDPEAAVIKQTL